MRLDTGLLSRRSILQALAALAGAAALPSAFTGRHAHAAMPTLPPNFGRGRSVAVAGAGVAGLTSAYVLARHGFRVTVYEADSRYGGRSLTPRPVRAEYRDWWFAKYHSGRQFPAMYVSEYREDPARSPDPQPQVCRFDDPLWDPQSGKDPLELFLNAGPGRIPSDHVAVLDLCRRIGVDLEPYIFLSASNLLQSAAFNGGVPIPFRQINYSLMGQIAEMLATVVRDGHALGQYSDGYRNRVLAMLQQFGDLNGNLKYDGSSRLGFSHPPGGWRDAGVVNPVVPFDQTLNSGFAGGGGPASTAGPVLFNADNIIWQTSLLQPIGGMDRIWQRLMMQEIPADAVELRNDDPRSAALGARDAGASGRKRYVGDLVVLNHRITAFEDDAAQPRMHVGFAWSDPATGKAGEGSAAHDFCISTMAPNLLATLKTSLPGGFRAALGAVLQSPAIKVGWQSRDRFWETGNQIYGGISWTDDPIRQIWYPSEDYGAHTGVLTGAYNSGPQAEAFGNLTQTQRIEAALSGGEKLHAGFSQKVHADKGLTIAWHLMPHQVGGWAVDTANTQPEIYHKITTLPQGRLYLAGDAWSQLPGWKEGAVTSAYAAVEAIAYGMTAGKTKAAR